MAINTVTSLNIASTGSTVITTNIVDRFLKVFEPNLMFWKFSEAPVSEKGYASSTWIKPNRLTITPDQALMTAGETPESTNIKLDSIEAKSKQYGLYVTLTDELLLRLDGKNIPAVTTDLVAKNMARIVDRVVQDEVLDNATNRLYASTTSGGARAANRAALTASNKMFAYDLTEMFTTLQSNYAPFYDEGTYKCIMHPRVYHGLLTESGTNTFFTLNQYKRPERIDKAVVGVWSNIEIYTSAYVKTYSSTITVYPTVVFGEQAYGASQLSSMEMIAKPLGSAGTADPLNQRMTIGAKTFFASKILQQSAIMVLESAGL